MRFRFTRRERSLISATPSSIEILVDGVPAAPFEDVLPPGTTVEVSATDVLTTADTRYRFREWSNGRPRTFTLTPQTSTPDTITARYDREFRVETSFEGTGSVSSSLAGSPPELFAAEGSRVTLTAAAAPGAEFLGWTGDTTAAAPVLELTMGRPYRVRARFSVSPEVVAVVDAVRAVLGSGPPLSPAITQGLDGQGNRNGRLDVGDVLAYLDRNPTLSGAMLRKLLAAAEARR